MFRLKEHLWIDSTGWCEAMQMHFCLERSPIWSHHVTFWCHSVVNMRATTGTRQLFWRCWFVFLIGFQNKKCFIYPERNSVATVLKSTEGKFSLQGNYHDHTITENQWNRKLRLKLMYKRQNCLDQIENKIESSGIFFNNTLIALLDKPVFCCFKYGQLC